MNKIEHTKNQLQTTLKEGQFFFEEEDADTYILALVGRNKYQLISLKEGNRFIDPSPTMEGAFGSRREDFTLITDPFTITPQ